MDTFSAVNEDEVLLRNQGKRKSSGRVGRAETQIQSSPTRYVLERTPMATFRREPESYARKMADCTQ
jgi:hypothetical protein